MRPIGTEQPPHFYTRSLYVSENCKVACTVSIKCIYFCIDICINLCTVLMLLEPIYLGVCYFCTAHCYYLRIASYEKKLVKGTVKIFTSTAFLKRHALKLHRVF